MTKDGPHTQNIETVHLTNLKHLLFCSMITMKKKRKPSRTRWRTSNWCPHKRFQNPHSWRRLERREERVRQHYENKGTPRARWINTGRPCRGPARKPNHQQFLHLLQLCWIWVCFIDAKERCNITRFQDALVWGFNHGKPRALRQEGERRFLQLTMIWISHLHTCRSCSLLTYILFRAQRTPWFIRTRNTIANPPGGFREKKGGGNKLKGGRRHSKIKTADLRDEIPARHRIV